MHNYEILMIKATAKTMDENRPCFILPNAFNKILAKFKPIKLLHF